MPKKYYEILGVSETATQEEIKKAYKDLVLKWHPDKFGSTGHLAQNREVATEKFKEIGEVYRVLSDSMIRSMYDEYGEKWKEHLEATGNEEFFEDDANKRERLAQTKVIFYINNELSLHWKLEEEDLDPKLWIPHHDWREKVRSLEGEELEAFRVKMTDTIRKTEKEKKNSSFKKEVIERIESSLATRNLNIEDLELNNRGYKEEINRIKIDDSDKSFEEITGIEKRVKTDMEFKRKMLSRKNSKSERELDVNMDIYEKESAHGLKSIGKKLKQKAVKVVKSHSNPQVLEASSGQQQWEYVTHPEDLARKQKIIESPVRRLSWQQEFQMPVDLKSTKENDWIKILKKREEESKKVEADYQKLIDDKNKEINQLKQQNQDLEKKLSGLLQTKQHEIKEIESQKNNEFIKQSAIEIPLTLTPGNKKTNDLQQVVVKNVKVADLEADIRNNQNRLEKLVSSAKNELKSNSMNPQKAKTKTDDYQSYLDEFLKLQELITNSENNSDQESVFLWDKEVRDYLIERRSRIEQTLTEKKLVPKKLGEIRKIKEQVIKLEIQKLAMIKNRANLLPLENFSADFQPQVLTTQRQNLNTADFTHVVSFIDDSSSKPLPSRPTEEENNAQQEQNNQEVQIQIPPKSNN